MGATLSADLPQDLPQELPGDWKVGEVAYFVSVGHTLLSGDELRYGDRGQVVGASAVHDGQDENRVDVHFEGNEQAVACFLDAISREPPPETFGDNWRVGDKAVFTGSPEPENGIQLGMVCEVIGPAPPHYESGVAVLFPGHSVPVIVTSKSLAHKGECPLVCPWSCVVDKGALKSIRASEFVESRSYTNRLVLSDDCLPVWLKEGCARL